MKQGSFQFVVSESFVDIHEGLPDDVHAEVIAETKSKNFSSDHILHDRKIDPFSLESDVRNISSKLPEWNKSLKCTRKNVWGHSMFQCSFHDLLVWIPSSYFCK